MEILIFFPAYFGKQSHSAWRDAFQTSWSPRFDIRFSFIQSYRKGPAKVQRKKVTDLGAFRLETSAMVPKIARNDRSNPDSSFKLRRVINESKKGILFTVTKAILNASSMYSFR